ncbi:YajQ family cyclic di-GMP-binding protein [Salsipaludibacter albus]|uniref:YajQ family cyclic di-GMP-binding protein n=1 Tax=Salsipaludibacter albus TaxID=2849650 RepID=UPI001EE3A74E|nr:YajQ family cyclic di-GMP-binding protein [Salsipaludibacter albus]MBY5161532.1 YajQ family cyclic di-GMP-binding protein [Salsipaludibacter albus]
MAESSFDIEAGADLQEVDNALNQAAREVRQRWDFKDTDTVIEWTGEREGIKVESNSEGRVDAAVEVLRDKFLKRKVSLKVMEVGDHQPVSGGRTRVDVGLVTTLTPELAKRIVKDVKATKLKVTPTNMGDQVRVSGKKRDDLQAIQKLVRDNDYEAPLRFTNYR